jgi:hypothetical protein
MEGNGKCTGMWGCVYQLKCNQRWWAPVGELSLKFHQKNYLLYVSILNQAKIHHTLFN